MATLTTTCPRCGSVSLAADQIELRVVADDAQPDCYTFTCPLCRQHVRKPADTSVVRLLRAGGVTPTPIEHPGSAETPPSNLPPLTHDDLLDFHQLLQHHDRLTTQLV